MRTDTGFSKCSNVWLETKIHFSLVLNSLKSKNSKKEFLSSISLESEEACGSILISLFELFMNFFKKYESFPPMSIIFFSINSFFS